MTQPLKLALVLHNHQPVGNFDGVFEAAYQDSYLPFLEVLSEHPDIPISLHTSGSLMEWLVARHPEYLDRLRELVQREQVEIVGGPYYEPILASIPIRDRIGQIKAYSAFLEKQLATSIRGIWVPERVWEQGFASNIVDAGIEYTLLDDFHFRNAGLPTDELHGYYLTEDEGKLLKVFPGSERLRYTIPFQSPVESIEYLKGVAQKNPNAVVVFGDDGEKFGTWPGTKEHVYKNGWLRQFFKALRENQDWLELATLAQIVDSTSPIGKVYLPDASYREMTEWALPVPRQLEYSTVTHAHEHDADWSTLKQFLRGGFWRNFRVKYSEANEMYCRMLEVSQKLGEAEQRITTERERALVEKARISLYRGQCNCPYWHGAFGGLYLPHLRNAIYQQLIEADNLLSQLEEPTGTWCQIVADDFNKDARKEIRINTDRFLAYFSPSRGGHLYEFDIRATRHNLLATLNRRPEAYHEKIRHFAEHGPAEQGKVASIHDLVIFKQPDLDKKLHYDHWARKSLVDHFFQPGLTLDAVSRGEGEVGDFVSGVYETLLRRSPARVECRMQREGQVGPFRVRLTKTVVASSEVGPQLEVRYELENLPREVPLVFGVEFNFAGMAAGASDRYYYDSRGRQIGQLESRMSLETTDRIGLVDEWLGLDVSLDVSRPAEFWTFPIETISQSEAGFEAVHQSCTVIPHWSIVADESGRWETTITLSVDTSAAQARQLREAAAVS